MTPMAMTMTAPACPMASLAKPISNGKTVPPKSPIIIRPDTSFCFWGMEVSAWAKQMEKMLSSSQFKDRVNTGLP